MVLDGVTIHNGAIIGAGSIVTRDVPPYAIVAGAPARVVRYRFNDAQIASLSRLAWWSWSDEMIRKRVHAFAEVDNFIALYSDVKSV
jgi:serine acetyltransferase